MPPTYEYNSLIDRASITYPTGCTMPDTWVLVFIACFYAIAIHCGWRLWRKEIAVATKLFWTVVLIVPVMGVLFYASIGNTDRSTVS